jgi:hypothetical protein
MKRLLWISLFVALMLLLGLYAQAGASSPPGFQGNWKATDPADQSNLRLWIVAESRSGGQVFDIREFDDSCNGCGGQPAKAHGVGVLTDATHVDATIVWWSVDAGQVIFGPFDLAYDYDPTTDTVTESYGSWSVVYHRDQSEH